MHHAGCSARLLFLEQAQKRYSDLIDVVATGSPKDESVPCADLWPVRVGIVFTQEDGPQGRGYSSAYWSSRLVSIFSAGSPQRVRPVADKMPPVPTAKVAVLHCTDS